MASALPFRARAVPLDAIAAHSSVVANLLAGSLVGAWLGGAGWVTRLASKTLYCAIAALLALIAAVLLFGHNAATTEPLLGGVAQAVVGVVCGFVIGIVASIRGVAGGELLIPTLTLLLFGTDIKLAGSLSLAGSLPTMLAGFARYSRDRSFETLGRNRAFVFVMAAGSVVGSFIGGQSLAMVPSAL